MKGLSDTVLFQLLSKLTQEELSGLERYTYYSQAPTPIRTSIQLFRTIDPKSCSKEQFFNSCHKNATPFSLNRFQMFFTSIREFIFEYLAVLNVQRSSMNKYHEAIKFAMEKHWDNEVLSLYRRLQRLIAKSPEGLDHYPLRYQLRELMHEIQIRVGAPDQSQQLRGDWSIFEEMFLVQYLRFKCMALDLELSGKANDSVPALDEGYLTKLGDRDLPQERPLISAYRVLHKMLLAPLNLENLFEARKLITQYIDHDAIEASYLGDLLRLLLNHATRLVNSKKLKRLYLIELSKIEVQHIQGSIHPLELKNNIALLTSAGKNQAAEMVLERFKDRIAPDPEGHALAYNKGVILFSKGEFPSAINLFESLIYSNHGTYLKTDGRFYLWRSRIAACLSGYEFEPDWYELEKEKSRQFFRRTTALQENSRKFYGTYLRIFVRFYGALGDTYSLRMRRLSNLLIDIQQLSEHPLKKWLLEIINKALRSKAGCLLIDAKKV